MKQAQSVASITCNGAMFQCEVPMFECRKKEKEACRGEKFNRDGLMIYFASLFDLFGLFYFVIHRNETVFLRKV